MAQESPTTPSAELNAATGTLFQANTSNQAAKSTLQLMTQEETPDKKLSEDLLAEENLLNGPPM